MLPSSYFQELILKGTQPLSNSSNSIHCRVSNIKCNFVELKLKKQQHKFKDEQKDYLSDKPDLPSCLNKLWRQILLMKFCGLFILNENLIDCPLNYDLL